MVDRHFHGDVERVVRLYYERSRRMVELGGFDIVGHADKVHYNAACCRPGILDEPWYDCLVRDYFAEIARRGYQMEINTKAYEELGVFYPDVRYFPLLRELGVRVQVNSDAHYPERIARSPAACPRRSVPCAGRASRPSCSCRRGVGSSGKSDRAPTCESFPASRGRNLRPAKASRRRGEGISGCAKASRRRGEGIAACENVPTPWGRNFRMRKRPHVAGKESRLAKASRRRGDEISGLRKPA